MIWNRARTIFLLFLVFLSALQFAVASEDDEYDNGCHLVVLHSKHGYTIDSRDFLRIPEKNQHFVKNPEYWGDIGQKNSILCLEKTVDDLLDNPEVKKIIFIAKSMGTATLLNFLGYNHNEKFAAVILEGVYASGGSAIPHYAEQYEPGIKNWPLVRFWLPQLARLLYPGYTPCGLQPIMALGNIQKKLPFFIAHATYDLVFPFKGALAIHGGLLRAGIDSTFVEPLTDQHTELIQSTRKIKMGGENILHETCAHHDDLRVFPIFEKWLQKNKLPFYGGIKLKTTDNEIFPKIEYTLGENAKKVYNNLLYNTYHEVAVGFFTDCTVIACILYLFYFVACM